MQTDEDKEHCGTYQCTQAVQDSLNLNERRHSVPYTRELLRYHYRGGFEKTDRNWTQLSTKSLCGGEVFKMR